MNPARCLALMTLACVACSQDPAPQASAAVYVLEAPALQVGVPAQLQLDLRTGIPTAGVELTIEGDTGLTVVDYAPKILPATNPAAGGALVFVDVVPTLAGTPLLTVRLVLHIGGKRLTRVVALPLAVSGPVEALPAADRLVEPGVRDGW
ncbi:MAG: hypothetical protein EXR87_05780 [Gammaproteobacteria bacterium]|nr:hypothetical protein [Gammaproteobacteria bacterium]